MDQNESLQRVPHPLKTTWETCFVMRFLIVPCADLLIPHRTSGGLRGVSQKATCWVSCALYTSPANHRPTCPPNHWPTYPANHLPTYPANHRPIYPANQRPTCPPTQLTTDPPTHHQPQEAFLIYLNIVNVSMLFFLFVRCWNPWRCFPVATRGKKVSELLSWHADWTLNHVRANKVERQWGVFSAELIS